MGRSGILVGLYWSAGVLDEREYLAAACISSFAMAKDRNVPRASNDFACCAPPALSSIAILSAHNSSFLALCNLPFSSRLLALIVTPACSSNRADKIHSGILLGHDLHPCAYAARASVILPWDERI